MELFNEGESRLGLPLELGLREDPMDAVRRAFPGQDFAIDAVNRAFARRDPAERTQQDSSTCGISGARTSENRAHLEEAGNARKSCAQQDPFTSEKCLEGENAGQHRSTPPVPAELGDKTVCGWKRRTRLGRVPDEREPDADRVSALEKALTGFVERRTDAAVNPTVGACFDSVAEAYDFYNLYSWEMGFGIRYGKSRLNAMRCKSMQEIVCCHSVRKSLLTGYFYAAVDFEKLCNDFAALQGKPKTDSKSHRCECTALIRLLRTEDNGWYVTEHRKVHNHALEKTFGDKVHWPSHMHIDKYTRDLVHRLREGHVNLGVYNTISSFFGRRENTPFTKPSIRTVCANISREQADDARNTMGTAAALGEKDPENHTQEETPFNCLGLTSTTLDSVNMPIDSPRYHEQDNTQRNAEAGRLAHLMLAFGDCHLVLKSCTYDDLINSKGTMSSLEKAVNTVTPHLQQGIFGDLWSRAHNSGGIVSAQVLTIRDLFRFTRWLTTTMGQHNLWCVQQHVQQVKSGKGVFEPEQLALLNLYQAENDEHSREMSKLQEERDTKIAHYKAKIDEARALFEASVEASKVHYPVAASYAPLDANELRGQCWTAYLTHCKEGRDLNRDSLSNIEKYGLELQPRHLFEFCSQEANRQALLKYAQTKVKKLKEAGPAHGENTFSGYMTLLDIEKAYALLAGEEQAADVLDTIGDGENADRNNGPAREGGGEDVPGAPQQKRQRQSQSYVWG